MLYGCHEVLFVRNISDRVAQGRCHGERDATSVSGEGGKHPWLAPWLHRPKPRTYDTFAAGSADDGDWMRVRTYDTPVPIRFGSEAGGLPPLLSDVLKVGGPMGIRDAVAAKVTTVTDGPEVCPRSRERQAEGKGFGAERLEDRGGPTRGGGGGRGCQNGAHARVRELTDGGDGGVLAGVGSVRTG